MSPRRQQPFDPNQPDLFGASTSPEFALTGAPAADDLVIDQDLHVLGHEADPPSIASSLASSQSAGTTGQLVDAASRALILDDLESTLFVEAGAGAGKTTALTGRIVRLVRSGIPITAIAAITFTEKAAADLRRRVRDALERGDDALSRAALDELDAAAIGTLHAFAGRVLREFPVEVGLPPSFSVLDEVGSDLAFDERWTAFIEDLLADDHRGELVLYADAEGYGIRGLRDIALGFGANWDLVDERVELTVKAPVAPNYRAVADRLVAYCNAADVPDGDRLGPLTRELAAWASLLAESDDQFAALQTLRAFKFPAVRTVGNKTNWAKHPSGTAGLDEMRRDLDQFKAEFESLLISFRSAWEPTIGAELGRFTLDAAIERRTAGELEFHDLLVLARDLVRDRPSVRRQLHDRYQRLLLDEFQDTDPIQLELAVWLGSDPDHADTSDWRDVTPMPGRLFFVGDPKQSIYRFRRADIAQFLSARERVGATLATLNTNFRSAPQVLSWVNEVFAKIIVESPNEQPAYTELAASHTDDGSVTVLGLDAHLDGPDAEELRRREANEVVAALQTALHDGWVVHEEVDELDDAGSVVRRRIARPCRLGDIAILVPARTSLPVLQIALTDAGIPYQAENASLVYATSEIRHLLLALRAIDDLTDELALVSTLRSPLFGCSDPDLFEWKQAGGSWRLDRQPSPEATGAVADAISSLRTLAGNRHWMSPSELLQRLVDECRVFELALAGPGARDAWRRVRFIIDQARAWSDAGGWGLRNYLAWTKRQGDDGRYVAEAVLPETDLDAVRIMTIHAAKGLEFPIVVVSGLTTKVAGNRRIQGPVWTPDGWTLAASEAHEAFKPIDEQLNRFERLRLLYVACTRAEGHLVVSLHRKGNVDSLSHSSATLAELLALANVGVEAATTLDPRRAADFRNAPDPLELAWPDAHEWELARQAAVASAKRPQVLAATTLARQRAERRAIDAGLDKDGVDLELPPWQRGRYGSAVGRAVHGVLQTIDFATGEQLKQLASAQAAAEGIVGKESVITQLAASALTVPIVNAAAHHPCWRELYVAAPVGSIVIEGYVDLLVKTPDGYVLVDYKTDHIADDEALAVKVERYGRQLAAYGVALEQVLGEPVAQACLVLCEPGGGRQIAIERWPVLLDELRAELHHERTTSGSLPRTTPSPA